MSITDNKILTTMASITGTNHLAYYNGTACPITLPFDGVSWLKIAKEQYVEIDNNFGILHIYTKQKKQKVNAKCECGSKKKYKVCCMNK